MPGSGTATTVRSGRLATVPKFRELNTAATVVSLAKKRRLALVDLEAEPFILMQEGHCLAGQALSFCRMEGFTPRVSFRSAQIETVRAFVAAGWGVSVVPEMACTEADGSGEGVVRYRPLAEMRRTIGVIRRQDRTPTRAVAALLEFFQKEPPRT